MVKCVIRSCKNHGKLPGISYHRISLKLKTEWMKAINVRRPYKQYSIRHLVCSDHFRPEDFLHSVKRRYLRKEAVPTLLLDKPATENTSFEEPVSKSVSEFECDSSSNEIISSDDTDDTSDEETSSSDDNNLINFRSNIRLEAIQQEHNYSIVRYINSQQINEPEPLVHLVNLEYVDIQRDPLSLSPEKKDPLQDPLIIKIDPEEPIVQPSFKPAMNAQTISIIPLHIEQADAVTPVINLPTLIPIANILQERNDVLSASHAMNLPGLNSLPKIIPIDKPVKDVLFSQTGESKQEIKDIHKEEVEHPQLLRTLDNGLLRLGNDIIMDKVVKDNEYLMYNMSRTKDAESLVQNINNNNNNNKAVAFSNRRPVTLKKRYRMQKEVEHFIGNLTEKHFTPDLIEGTLRKVKYRYDLQQDRLTFAYKRNKFLLGKVSRLGKRINNMKCLLEKERKKIKHFCPEPDNEVISSDTMQICRTCLSSKNLQPLYTLCSCIDEEKCVIDMLVSCTLFQFSKDDNLPDKICSKCVTDLKAAYRFLKKCEKSDEQLRARFQTDEPVNKVSKTRVKKGKKGQSCRKLSAMSKTVTSNDNAGDSCYFENNRQEKSSQNTQSRNCGQPYTCKYCGLTYRTYKQIQKHWKEMKHPRNNYDLKVSCDTCKKDVPMSKINEHKEMHRLEKPYCCEKCGLCFRNRIEFQGHLNTHDVECFKCGYCEKVYKTKSALRNHECLHTSELIHICNVCGENFHSSNSFRLHMRCHKEETECGKDEKSPEKNFKCSICLETFSTNLILQYHQRSHKQSVKNYTCHICNKQFTQKRLLVKHKLLHRLMRPFCCDVCNKQFTYKHVLNMHKKIHTDEKPFSCQLCKKSFTQLAYLKNHLVTHTREKRFECEHCGRHFIHKSSLETHRKIHTGDKLHLCTTCGIVFSTRDSLLEHQNLH